MTNTETILQDITEGPAHFIINLTDYLDTGIFLDHRPLRKIIYKNSQNKNVLNLFSYTGTISVMAALGGGKVWSVDLSNSYTNWAYDNFRLNNITFADHHFITEDTFTFLKESTDLFDLIILDPPTFSNSKKFEGTLDIQRDHEKLIELCISRLTNAGTLYFSNNLRTFKLNPNLFEKYYIKDISLKTIPADFRDTKIHQCFEIKQK
jgi:23S rRNA (cytosine1962-C5)-methyltransferase/23S rRNA (guanine2445-N2)-methyltransferase / 23S rRNA (guanine2069-N7)-methyltransferase